MQIIWSQQIDEILNVGRFLQSEGILNWALTKEQSLIAISQLSNLQIPVLGGDVYEENRGVIQPNYDNWYSDRLAEETKEEFLIRSINNAKSFVQNYKFSAPNHTFFVIVPAV